MMKKIMIALLFMSSFAAQANILDGVSNVVHDVADTGADAVDTVLGRGDRYYRDGRYYRVYDDGRYRTYENGTVLPDNYTEVADTRDVRY